MYVHPIKTKKIDLTMCFRWGIEFVIFNNRWFFCFSIESIPFKLFQNMIFLNFWMEPGVSFKLYIVNYKQSTQSFNSSSVFS